MRKRRKLSRIRSKTGPKTKRKFRCMFCSERFWTMTELNEHIKKCKKAIQYYKERSQT